MSIDKLLTNVTRLLTQQGKKKTCVTPKTHALKRPIMTKSPQLGGWHTLRGSNPLFPVLETSAFPLRPRA